MLSSHSTSAKTVTRFVPDVQAYLKKYEMAGLIPSLNSKNKVFKSCSVQNKTSSFSCVFMNKTIKAKWACVLHLVKKIGVTHQMDICVTQNRGDECSTDQNFIFSDTHEICGSGRDVCNKRVYHV